MFATRTLPVVVATDQERGRTAIPRFLGALRETAIHGGKDEPADRRDVAAKRQHAGSRRHDFVGRYVIANLEQRRTPQGIRQGFGVRQRHDVRAHFKVGTGILILRFDHAQRAQAQAFRFHDFGVWPVQRPRVGDCSAQRRRRRRLRTAQVDLVFLGTGSAREIARHGTQADTPRRRRLTHADATVAAGLVQARTRVNQGVEQTHFGQIFENLPTRRIDIERDAVVDRAAIHDHRRHGEIAQSRIRGRTDVALVDLATGHLRHRHHLAGAARQGDQRFERGQVDLVVLVVVGILVRRQGVELIFATLARQKPSYRVVRRKHRGGRAEFSAHVGDHVAVHRAEMGQTRSVVLDDAANAAVHIVAAQHLQNHVLGADPVRQAAAEPHSHDLRHLQVERPAGHCQRDFETAGADRQHAHGAGCAAVAVRTQQRTAGSTEAFHVYGMTHTRTRAAEPHAETPAGAAQKQMIIRILEVGLQQVVIDVLRRNLGAHAAHLHRLEFLHHQCAGGILRQGLVDPDRDALAGNRLAFDEMGFDELAGEIELGHGWLPRVPAP